MRPDAPRISVLLPFREALGTLDAAVRSIADQTLGDWELLLVDNASTDDGPAVATAWVERDQRVRLIHEPVVGIAHALNAGLAHARGRFIARMDADDVAHPERLAMQLAYLERHTDIGVTGTRTRFASTVPKSSGMRWFVDWQNAIITAEEHYLKRFVDVPIAHPTAMFRRELVDRHGGYATGPVPEDHELWMRWMDAGVRIAKLPEELLTWNDHPGRLSRTHANYGKAAFFTTKAKWLARWFLRKHGDARPVIIAGTSLMCRERARLLEAEGMRVSAFTDVRPRKVPGYDWIPHDRLPPAGRAFIVSFISQRGTGDRIAGYLASRGLIEGEDFILAA